MADEGEAGSAEGAMPGKTTSMSFMAARTQWKRNKNGKRVRSETSESASARADWRSQIDRTMCQQTREVTQLHQTIDRMARISEAHMAREEAHSLSIKESLEDKETRWDGRHTNNELWGTGITDKTAKVLAKTTVGEVAPVQEEKKEV